MSDVEVSDPVTQGHKKRRVIVIVFLLAVIVGGIALCSRRKSAAGNATTSASGKGGKGGGGPVPVMVAPAKPDNVPVYLDGLGNVSAFYTVTVRTRIDGQLQQVNVREGQLVTKGQELALIDPRTYQAAVSQVEAKRFQDTATLENARRDLQRYADLYRDGVLPQQQYDAQKSLVTVDEGLIKADDAAIETARLNVAYCHITAPIDGRVGLRAVDPGNMVHASDTNGLFVITQMQPVAVVFTLTEDKVAAVSQQMRSGALPVEAWSKDNSQKIAEGVLQTLDNEIDPSTGTIRLKAVFANGDGALFPNQFVNARLLLEIRHDALTIPATAVQQGSQGSYVYVVKQDMTVESRPITIALTQGAVVVVGTGLTPGQQVVTDGQDKLQPGSKVEVQQRGGDRAGGGTGSQKHNRQRS